MEKLLFTVFDSKSRVFSNPFTSANLLTAQRDFERAANDKNSDICLFPNDYTLYEIGKFDDTLGIVIPHENPYNRGLATQYKPEV